LERGTLKQRIVQLLGNSYTAKLVTVQEKTDYMNIYGFAGKPDTAKKTRGDQYFFVNNRFIRSPYLHHAVMSAFQEMIASDSFPLYVLFIDLDPSQVDINVHPTKQEIKFEDEKIVYAFVQAAVKHALAQFSITPAIEFDLDPAIQQLDAVTKPFTEEKQAAAAGSALFKNFTQKHQAHFIDPTEKSDLKNWKDFYEAPGEKFESLLDQLKKDEPAQEGGSLLTTQRSSLVVEEDCPLTQVLNTYIVATTNRGFILINQQLAHERILYERFSATAAGQAIPVQKSLFPVTLEMSAQDAVLLSDLMNDLNQLGYLIEPFGNNTFVIQGTPADVQSGNEKTTIEKLLEQFKHFSSDLKFSKREKLWRSLAWQQAVKPGTALSEEEMRGLVKNLFRCPQANITAAGQPTYIEFKRDYLDQLFRRQ
jgi:DNA mismatch repair protein MutL